MKPKNASPARFPPSQIYNELTINYFFRTIIISRQLVGVLHFPQELEEDIANKNHWSSAELSIKISYRLLHVLLHFLEMIRKTGQVKNATTQDWR